MQHITQIYLLIMAITLLVSVGLKTQHCENINVNHLINFYSF